jgi:hypothetical protein
MRRENRGTPPRPRTPCSIPGRTGGAGSASGRQDRRAGRAEASAYFQRLNDETDANEPRATEYPIFGGPEAERPFLPSDDEED